MSMLSEINEMPGKAVFFLGNTGTYQLPAAVPYIGMGSSYFAPLAFKYMGMDIYPELASEFFNYQLKKQKIPNGVLLSQSGRSTEVLWCAGHFQQFTAISNDTASPLCRHSSAASIVPLLAGEEKYSSSKTYINTLLALFKGFGIDVRHAVQLMLANMDKYEQQGKALAEAVAAILPEQQVSGLYITGSGPNIATALQAALIMSESSKLNFNGLPMAQYDHGPKETAKNSIVINILAKGPSFQRSKQLAATIAAAGATVLTVEEPEAAEHESVLHHIIPFNYMAYYLATNLQVNETFVVGGKITEVNAG